MTKILSKAAFTDGNVNPTEAANMKTAATKFHHFELSTTVPNTCAKCGRGKSMMYHRADKRVHKALEDRLTQRRNLMDVETADLSKWDFTKAAGCKAKNCSNEAEDGGGGFCAKHQFMNHSKKVEKTVAPLLNGVYDMATSAIPPVQKVKRIKSKVKVGVMKSRLIADGELTILRKDQTGANHSINVRQGWERDENGNRQWQVDVNHNQTHSFPSPEAALKFANSDTAIQTAHGKVPNMSQVAVDNNGDYDNDSGVNTAGRSKS